MTEDLEVGEATNANTNSNSNSNANIVDRASLWNDATIGRKSVNLQAIGGLIIMIPCH